MDKHASCTWWWLSVCELRVASATCVTAGRGGRRLRHLQVATTLAPVFGFTLGKVSGSRLWSVNAVFKQAWWCVCSGGCGLSCAAR